MRPLARSSPCNGGAEVGDGVLPWPEALSPERCSVARWRHLTITVPGHIIILIIRAPIMLLRRPAITLRAMALRQVGTQSPTACNASGLTIRGAERILGQTAVAIHALERCETRTEFNTGGSPISGGRRNHVEERRTGGLRSNSGQIALDWALADCGLVMNSWVDVEPDLRMGPASSMFSPGGAATPRPCARYFPRAANFRAACGCLSTPWRIGSISALVAMSRRYSDPGAEAACTFAEMVAGRIVNRHPRLAVPRSAASISAWPQPRLC
jgi:hypothetical protein